MKLFLLMRTQLLRENCFILMGVVPIIKPPNCITALENSRDRWESCPSAILLGTHERAWSRVKLLGLQIKHEVPCQGPSCTWFRPTHSWTVCTELVFCHAPPTTTSLFQQMETPCKAWWAPTVLLPP